MPKIKGMFYSLALTALYTEAQASITFNNSKCVIISSQKSTVVGGFGVLAISGRRLSIHPGLPTSLVY